jgi:ATP-dependent protease ClpP protease subunit
MRTLYIFSEVTSDVALSVRAAINEDRLDNIWLCTPGGDVAAALAIYDALVGKGITVIGTGQVSSAGIIILLGGDRRYATPNTRLLVHPVTVEPTNEEAKDKDVCPECQGETSTIQTILAGLIVQRSNLSAESVDELCSKESYLGVDEAIAAGFIDNVWPQVWTSVSAGALEAQVVQ